MNVGVRKRVAGVIVACRQATESATTPGGDVIASHEIAEWTGINATQIRRDLSGLNGVEGKRGVGYVARDLEHKLTRRLNPQTGRVAVVTHDVVNVPWNLAAFRFHVETVAAETIEAYTPAMLVPDGHPKFDAGIIAVRGDLAQRAAAWLIDAGATAIVNVSDRYVYSIFAKAAIVNLNPVAALLALAASPDTSIVP